MIYRANAGLPGMIALHSSLRRITLIGSIINKGSSGNTAGSVCRRHVPRIALSGARLGGYGLVSWPWQLADCCHLPDGMWATPGLRALQRLGQDPLSGQVRNVDRLSELFSHLSGSSARLRPEPQHSNHLSGQARMNRLRAHARDVRPKLLMHSHFWRRIRLESVESHTWLHFVRITGRKTRYVPLEQAITEVGSQPVSQVRRT